MGDDLLWQLGTVIASIAGAWATMKAEQRHLRRDMDEVIKEQDEARGLSLELAVATNTILHLGDRLKRIEDKLDKSLRVNQ